MALAGPDGSRGILHPQSIRCAMIPYANSWSRRLIVLGLNTTGLVLLLSLPAIWIAWTPRGLVMVMGAGVLAGALYCLLAAIEELRFGAGWSKPSRNA
jgi:hypothetical protein